MLIIPSGKPKILDKNPEIKTVPATEAYTGTFHKLCRQYAEQFGLEYVILSPFYGFLRPSDAVPHTYDVRFTLKGVNANTIQLETLKKQWQSLAVKETAITVLGGKKFVFLMNSIVSEETTLSFPLINRGGIGRMQQALKEAIQRQQPLL